MRRPIRWAVLTLAGLMLAAGLCLGRMQNEPQGELAGNSASLGLMLLSDADGVYVLAVSDHSPAYLAGLEPGDYILSAGGAPVPDVAALDEAINSGRSLEMVVRRQRQELRLSLPGR